MWAVRTAIRGKTTLRTIFLQIRSYTSVRGDGGLPGGTAGFNISGTTLNIFWGSPDQYNSITFWTGVGGTGELFTVTGGQLTPFPGLILGLGHDFVHFLSDVQFNSIVLFSWTTCVRVLRPDREVR